MEPTHGASLGGRRTLPSPKGTPGGCGNTTGSTPPLTLYHGGMPYLTDPERLAELLVPNAPAYRADQLRSWLYDTPVLSTSEMTNLPEDNRVGLADRLWPFAVETEQTADDGTTKKWLFRAPDGAAIEAVLMGYPKRTTLCISSQAGCALGCTFCATGQFGFERHLEPGEIYAQIAFASAYVRKHGLPGSPDRITNIVYMGMGEPLANYRRVRESLRRIIEVRGHVGAFGDRFHGRSRAGHARPGRGTVGRPAGGESARRRRRASVGVGSTEPQVPDRRSASRPPSSTSNAKGRRVSLEWTLMDGVNDTPDQAEKLAAIARRLGAHINLIALNPTPLSPDRSVFERANPTLHGDPGGSLGQRHLAPHARTDDRCSMRTAPGSQT